MQHRSFGSGARLLPSRQVQSEKTATQTGQQTMFSERVRPNAPHGLQSEQQQKTHIYICIHRLSYGKCANHARHINKSTRI